MKRSGYFGKEVRVKCDRWWDVWRLIVVNRKREKNRKEKQIELREIERKEECERVGAIERKSKRCEEACETHIRF